MKRSPVFLLLLIGLLLVVVSSLQQARQRIRSVTRSPQPTQVLPEPCLDVARPEPAERSLLKAVVAIPKKVVHDTIDTVEQIDRTVAAPVIEKPRQIVRRIAPPVRPVEPRYYGPRERRRGLFRRR